jgi:asparagine synthase (glutamine-hydrolysing)
METPIRVTLSMVSLEDYAVIKITLSIDFLLAVVARVISGLPHYPCVNHLEVVLARLDEATKGSLGGEQVALMFSGGIDSCIIAQLARRHAEVHLYTVGLEGAHDISVACQTAERLQLPWTSIPIDAKEVRRGVAAIQGILGPMDPLPISFELPLFFVAEKVTERVLSSGQGADEAFGGYARYEAMTPEARRTAMHKDVEGLLAYGSPMEKRLASHFGKDIRHPFLDREVIEAAITLPDDMVVKDGQRKVALRAIAPTLGLEVEASRPKKAAQYGSGIMHCMKAEAKKDGMELRDWVAHLRFEGRK